RRIGRYAARRIGRRAGGLCLLRPGDARARSDAARAGLSGGLVACLRSLSPERSCGDGGPIGAAMKYQVTVNGRTYEVELDATRVTVDGVEHRAVLAEGSGTPERLLVLDGRPYPLPMWSEGRGNWAVLEA